MGKDSGSERYRTRVPRQQKASTVLAMVGVIGLMAALVGLVLVLTSRPAAVSTGGGGKAATSPKLVVDRDEIDLGEVPVDEMVRAVFTVSNAGDQPLQVIGEPRVELAKGC